MLKGKQGYYYYYYFHHYYHYQRRVNSVTGRVIMTITEARNIKVLLLLLLLLPPLLLPLLTLTLLLGTLFLNDVKVVNRNWDSIRPSETRINIPIFDRYHHHHTHHHCHYYYHRYCHRVYELEASCKDDADHWTRCIMAHWS